MGKWRPIGVGLGLGLSPGRRRTPLRPTQGSDSGSAPKDDELRLARPGARTRPRPQKTDLTPTLCESSKPLSDVLVINDNCLWTNGSWRNKNAGLDHIEQKILEIYKHWLWIK